MTISMSDRGLWTDRSQLRHVNDSHELIAHAKPATTDRTDRQSWSAAALSVLAGRFDLALGRGAATLPADEAE